MEVLGGGQVRPAPFEPRGAGQRLTGRTVAVATGVVPDAAMAAAVALLDVAAEGGGAALLDGRHHSALRRGEGGPGLSPEGVAIAAEDLRHGERGARHDRRSVDIRVAFPVRALGAGPADSRSSRPWMSRPAGSWPWSAGSDARAAAESYAGRCPPREGGPRTRGARRQHTAHHSPLSQVHYRHHPFFGQDVRARSRSPSGGPQRPRVLCEARRDAKPATRFRATGITAYLSIGRPPGRRGDARARAADRGARIAEDDEALRPDGRHGDGRRDRAHRDLSVGVPPGQRRDGHFCRPPSVSQTTVCDTC